MIILLARYTVFKYNSVKIFKFLSGGYCSTCGGLVSAIKKNMTPVLKEEIEFSVSLGSPFCPS